MAFSFVDCLEQRFSTFGSRDLSRWFSKFNLPYSKKKLITPGLEYVSMKFKEKRILSYFV